MQMGGIDCERFQRIVIPTFANDDNILYLSFAKLLKVLQNNTLFETCCGMDKQTLDVNMCFPRNKYCDLLSINGALSSDGIKFSMILKFTFSTICIDSQSRRLLFFKYSQSGMKLGKFAWY